MKNFTKNSLTNSKKFPYILKICETNKINVYFVTQHKVKYYQNNK